MSSQDGTSIPFKYKSKMAWLNQSSCALSNIKISISQCPRQNEVEVHLSADGELSVYGYATDELLTTLEVNRCQKGNSKLLRRETVWVLNPNSEFMVFPNSDVTKDGFESVAIEIEKGFSIIVPGIRDEIPRELRSGQEQYQAFNLNHRLKKMFGTNIVLNEKALSFNSSSKLYPLYETSFA